MSKEHFGGERESSRSYSRAVKVQGGTTIYLAGVGGTPDGQGRSLAGDFTAQAHRAFERLRENVELAGGTLDDIVTMTVYTVMVTMSESLPSACARVRSISAKVACTWASKSPASDFPEASEAPVMPASQTILPPSVITAWE